MATARVFPWFTVAKGRVTAATSASAEGWTWRFPVLAAGIAALSAYAGNLMIGVLETGR